MGFQWSIGDCFRVHWMIEECLHSTCFSIAPPCDLILPTSPPNWMLLPFSSSSEERLEDSRSKVAMLCVNSVGTTDGTASARKVTEGVVQGSCCARVTASVIARSECESRLTLGSRAVDAVAVEDDLGVASTLVD